MAHNELFQEIAHRQPPSLLMEFWDFLRHSKKWWLLPILVLIVGMGVLIFFSSTPLAPFIYSMF